MRASDRDGTYVSSGVAGLDDILEGAYAANRVHLIEGRPGCGKTTIGLQFLLSALEQGERCLYITLSERKGIPIASRCTRSKAC
jgi:circadian clock protein KaiC